MNICIYLHYLVYSCIAFFLSSFFKHLSIHFFLLFSKTCKMYSIYLFFCINVSIFLTFFIYTFYFPTPGPRFHSLCLYSLSWFMLSFYRYIKFRSAWSARDPGIRYRPTGRQGWASLYRKVWRSKVHNSFQKALAYFRF